MNSKPTDRPDDDADANPKNKRGRTHMFNALTVNTPEFGEARISMTDEGMIIEADGDGDAAGLEELARNIFGAFSNDSAPRGIPLSTEFYVYENKSNNRARVHKADCGFCNHGEGSRRRRKSKSSGGGNVRWRGPFDAREAAFSEMENLGKKDIGACSACNP